MARAIITFLVAFVFIYGGIELFRSLTKKEKWALTKQVTYSTIIAVVTLALLTLFVILF